MCGGRGMKVGDLVVHYHHPELIGLIIESTSNVGISDPKFTLRHRVKWLKEDGIVATRGWNNPRMFGESVLVLISEA
jgi:hypothetical protein